MQIHWGNTAEATWILASSNIFWILFASPTLSSLASPQRFGNNLGTKPPVIMPLFAFGLPQGNPIIKQLAEARGSQS
jgi:hypothetical protein